MDALEYLHVKSPTNQYAIFNRVLGKGSFGVVLLSMQLKSQKYYAMKIISKKTLNKVNGFYNMRQEILFLSKMNHKNIIKMFESFEDDNFIYIVLEYCSNGTLYSKLKQKGPFSEQKAFKYFYQIVLAVQFLHQKSTIHRDLKLDNILLNELDQVKICDFNWATNLTNGQADPIICGTVDQMPPEVSAYLKHDIKLDIWNLGIILYEMVHNSLPILSYATQLSVSRKISLELQNLLIKLLSFDKNKRPTTEEILKHKWIQQMIAGQDQSDSSQSSTPKYHSKQNSCGSIGIAKHFKTEV